MDMRLKAKEVVANWPIGKILVVCGPRACGKTTLINEIRDLLERRNESVKVYDSHPYDILGIACYNYRVITECTDFLVLTCLDFTSFYIVNLTPNKELKDLKTNWITLNPRESNREVHFKGGESVKLYNVTHLQKGSTTIRLKHGDGNITIYKESDVLYVTVTCSDLTV